MWRGFSNDSESTCNSGNTGDRVRKIPWKRGWLPTPVFLPGESHEQKSLVGYSQWGHKELDMTEWLSTHLSLSIQREVRFLFSFFKSKPLWAFNLKPIHNYLNITITQNFKFSLKMKLWETLEQMAKKSSSLHVFPCSFFIGVFICLDLICTCSLSVYKSQFLILVKLKCFIFQAHHPRSWIACILIL